MSIRAAFHAKQTLVESIERAGHRLWSLVFRGLESRSLVRSLGIEEV